MPHLDEIAIGDVVPRERITDAPLGAILQFRMPISGGTAEAISIMVVAMRGEIVGASDGIPVILVLEAEYPGTPWLPGMVVQVSAGFRAVEITGAVELRIEQPIFTANRPALGDVVYDDGSKGDLFMEADLYNSVGYGGLFRISSRRNGVSAGQGFIQRSQSVVARPIGRLKVVPKPLK